MRRRSLRVVLCLIFVAAAGATGYRLFELEQEAGTQSAADRAFSQQIAELLLAIGDLRTAQQAYVAAGQEGPFWATRADTLRGTVLDGVARLKLLASARAAVESLDAAEQAIEDFAALDDRAEEYVQDGQQLMASDLIFTDGQETMRQAAEHVTLAGRRERQARAAEAARYSREQAVSLAAAAGVGVVVVGLLLPTGRSRDESGGAEHTDAKWRRPRTSGQTDRPLGLPIAAGESPGSESQTRQGWAALGALAEVCTNFSRGRDAESARGLLQRTSTLLGDAGVVVWMADADRSRLTPVLAHGYPAQLLQEMGPISKDDDNATAVAFREQQAQVVRAADGAHGALVVPIFSGPTCTGVVAAEIASGRESEVGLRSVAEIVAAQLTGLPSPQDASQAAPVVKRKRSG